MGWETANVHLGSAERIGAVRRDLEKRRGDWLGRASRILSKLVVRDWQAWRAHMRRHDKA